MRTSLWRGLLLVSHSLDLHGHAAVRTAAGLAGRGRDAAVDPRCVALYRCRSRSGRVDRAAQREPGDSRRAVFVGGAGTPARAHAGHRLPWNLLGYAASGSLALVQLTTLTGIYGLSFLVVAYNALLVWALLVPPARANRPIAAAFWLGATAAILIVVLVGGSLVPAAQPTHVAHLVQTESAAIDGATPRIGTPSTPPTWPRSTSITIAAGAEPARTWSSGRKCPRRFRWRQLPFAQRARRMARDSRSDFLLGVIDWKPAGNNSARALQQRGAAGPRRPRGIPV